MFNDVDNPIETNLNGGYAVQRNNIFQDTTLDSDMAVGTLTSLPYSYASVVSPAHGLYSKLMNSKYTARMLRVLW